MVTESGFDRYARHREDLNRKSQEELIEQEISDFALFLLCNYLSSNNTFNSPMNPASNTSVNSYNRAYGKIFDGLINDDYQRYKCIKTMAFTEVRAKGGHKVRPEKSFYISVDYRLQDQEHTDSPFSLEPFDLPVSLEEETFLEIKSQLPRRNSEIDLDTLQNRLNNLFGAIQLGDNFEDSEKAKSFGSPFKDGFN